MSKYNVLMVLADQHHAGLMGCAGHPQVITPNIDAFAESGIRFDQAYAQNPICTPSRVSILSGQYCHNHGYYGLSGRAPRLDNLFRHFKRNGYRTAGYGKLHLPESPESWIADDVDEFGDTYETCDGERGTTEYFRYLEERGLREWEDSYHNPWNYGKNTISLDAQPTRMPYEHTHEMWSTRKAMDFIEADPNRPFCIQISMQKPHHPLLPVQKFWDLYPDDLNLPSTIGNDASHRPPHFQEAVRQFRSLQWDYAREGESFEDGARRAWKGTLACVTQVDDVFGKLLRFLEEKGLSENTIVIYGSDHGCYHGMHGISEKAPGICSDNVCRVPMIWRVPGVTPKGMVCDQLVENIDMTPTLAELCGLPSFDSADGLDMTELLRGHDQPLRDVAVTENVWSKSMRWGKWRFVHYQPEHFDGADVGELYDLEADPEETINLYSDPKHADQVVTCRRLLLEWMIRTLRSSTGQETVKNENLPNYTKGMHFTYPICEDGRLPTPLQPRNKRYNTMYL
ncbi:sulfatase family protein [Puniceicoccus vermicola]|uniref:Sulfatase-like hydrolase/transferase n=1 Tax=Puniceicoccus vermicola TaxID=388746 RepID=A0A7X1B149_9BACT|nr:sulfatase-like hydrolase/transferase [Puniceicoccus vermicola]MBC2602593.1 sulfatase-like hydrolase/transferase [Puniceicoccus vermicola]